MTDRDPAPDRRHVIEAAGLGLAAAFAGGLPSSLMLWQVTRGFLRRPDAAAT